MEPIEDDNLISPYGSHYPPNASTLAAIKANSPQIAQIYEALLEETEKHIAPPLTTIHADLVESVFHYDEVTSTFTTAANAFGRRLYEYGNGKYTEITLYNPKTGNIVNFVWFAEHEHDVHESLSYHLYAGSWNNTRLWLKVYKTGVKRM